MKKIKVYAVVNLLLFITVVLFNFWVGYKIAPEYDWISGEGKNFWTYFAEKDGNLGWKILFIADDIIMFSC